MNGSGMNPVDIPVKSEEDAVDRFLILSDKYLDGRSSNELYSVILKDDGSMLNISHNGTVEPMEDFCSKWISKESPFAQEIIKLGYKGPFKGETITENKKSLKESRGEISFSGGFLANIVYVGDLCYCLNDAVYQDAIKLANYEGKFDSIASGMHVEGAFVSTDHGDGEYEGSDGRNYAVDAGIIGIVNITNASATEGEDFKSFSELGRVIKLPKYGPTQYEISRDSAGVITVDIRQGRFTETIAIPTGFAEEFTCNECGEEISEWEYRRYGGCCESCYRESMYGSDDEEEEEFEESVINEAKQDSAFLKKAAKIAKVKIACIEYFNNKNDWMVVLDSEDSYDADSFRNAVDGLLDANSGEHSYDDVEGLGDVHLGTAEYYEVSGDEYSDLDPAWRDKVVVYCEPSKKYKTRREMDW